MIWTGAADGLVQVTRDGGATWTDVTPPDLPEELGINAVEASPHEPGAAYVAATAYKFNDFTPYAFRTSDFGETWTLITDGIPEDHWVRVVREDTERRGLIYAGTELGAYVSFNDGDDWQPLQNNLPATPITDLKVHQGDLVAATQGRAFWILDDLSLLRQLHEQGDVVAGAPTWMFEPRAAYRQGGGGGGGGGAGGGTAGRNPPAGAILYINLTDSTETEVRLEFMDAGGQVLRTLTTEPGDGQGAPGRLTVRPGMNRVVWNLRRETLSGVEGLFVFGSLAGPSVPPGTYGARLTIGGEEAARVSFEVRDIPQIAAEVTAQQHRVREDLLARIRFEIEGLHGGVEDMGSVTEQVEAVAERTAEHPRADTVEAVADALADSVLAVDSMLVQRSWTTGQDPTVFITRLNQFFIYLHSAVDGTPGAPTKGMTDQFDVLTQDWRDYQGRIEWILGPGVDGFNRLLRDLGVEAVEVRRRVVS